MTKNTSPTRRPAIPSRDGGKADFAERSDHILEAAARVFRHHGYQNATLQDVASELGVTRAALYHYYGSKQQILEAIFEHAMTLAESELEAALATDKGPVDKLRDIIVRHTKIIVEGNHGPVFFREENGLSPEYADQLRKRRRRYDQQVMAILEQAIERGECTARDPKVAVYGLLGAVNWVHTWYEVDNALSGEQVGEHLADLVLQGLLIREDVRGGLFTRWTRSVTR